MSRIKYILCNISAIFLLLFAEVSSQAMEESPSFEKLDQDIRTTSLCFLDVEDLVCVSRVSSESNKFVNNNFALWANVGCLFLQDYLSECLSTEKIRGTVITHWLRMKINCLKTQEEVSTFIERNGSYIISPPTYLDGYIFKNLFQYSHASVLRNLFQDILKDERFRELWVAKGCMWLISDKIIGLAYGTDNYVQNPEEAVALVERLVAKGNLLAIGRKIEGLAEGLYGYDKNPEAAVALNEGLLEMKDLVAGEMRFAIIRKRDGLANGPAGFCGGYGYEQNLKAAVAFNEILVEQGNLEAIEWKKDGLVNGVKGYEKDPKAARELNEILIKNKIYQAIIEKIEGFIYGHPGYEQNPKAAAAFIDSLIEDGYTDIIWMKIEGLAQGKYGYDKDPEAAVKLNETFIAKNDPKAMERKIMGLANGSSQSSTDFGYEQNQQAAIALNENLISQGDPEAIQRKINSLNYGGFAGYKKNPYEAVIFIDHLAHNGNQSAIEQKIRALCRGHSGYQLNPEDAVVYMESLINEGNIGVTLLYMQEFYNGQLMNNMDLSRIAPLLDVLCGLNLRQAHYIKAFCLRQGLFGYEADEEAYRDYIYQHKIAY